MRRDGMARLHRAKALATLEPSQTSENDRMSYGRQQTLANVTAIAFGLCSLIAAGVIFATQL
jgi:hypothetical protein